MPAQRFNLYRTLLAFISNLSLTVKVASTASLVFLVFVVGVSLISYDYLATEFKNTIYEQQGSLINTLANSIDDKINITHQALIASAQKVTPQLMENPDQLQAFLDNEPALHSIFDTGLFVIDNHGKLLAESPFRANRRGRDLSEREYFKDAAQLQQAYISKPYASTRNHGQPALRMTAPIFDANGRFLGILAGRLDLWGSNILSKASQTKIGSKGYIYITDADGKMILHPDHKRILVSAQGSNPLFDKALLEGFEGSGEATNSYNVPMIFTFKRLHTTRWLLASAYPKQEANAPFQHALRVIAITLAIGLVLMLVVLSTLMRRLTQPLIQFTEHVETLPQRQDDQRLFPDQSRAEMGILVRAFNKMIETQDKQHLELQLHQQQLELLVQDRTAELRQAQQIGHIGNWKLLPATGQMSWSDEIYCILGYAPGQITPSREHLIAARHPDDAAMLEQTQQLALAQHNQHSVDHRIILPDNTVRWVHEEVRCQRDAQGQIISLSGTIQDITERKQVEQALIESREAAEAASRAKSLFLSSMSHELRTPLNAVLGFAQLLAMDDDASDEVRSNAVEIESAGRHLLDLVSDILDLARIESGHIDLSIEEIDPTLIMNECLSLLEAQARERHIRWQYPGQLPALRADRIRLRQIILNLLSNAIKYNREGGQIEIRAQLRPKNLLRISIRDSGQGIPPDRIHELFQPFNRIGAERGQVEGTGIGLVITKTLVQAMHGDIGVESSLGSGSTFWFELPLSESAKERSTVNLDASILAAEDHEPNRKLLQRQIEKLGYRVDFACDGNEALQMWQTGHYQLLITDCNMPVMDGYELAQAIRKRETVTGTHTPIVALTANSSKDAAKACIAAGMDDFLVKPVHLHQLQNTLSKWLSPEARQNQSKLLQQSPQQHPAYADYLETLAAMLGDNDMEEAGRMLHGFLESARECLADAGAALTARNGQDFVRATHRLKGSARMIGATALSDICQRAEQSGLRGDWEQMARELPDLAAALQETEERILALPHLNAPTVPEPELNPELVSLQLMLIDDDPFILNYLTRLLSSRGIHHIRFAGNGHAALQELKNNTVPIDVMVCDLNMPGMDGVEFLRHLADADYHGAIIIISGNADLLSTIYELAQAHGLRILGTLAKPFTPQRFFDILNLQFGERRLAKPRSQVPVLRPTDVTEGLLRGEFVPWFQPKVDAITLKPYGAEALARWRRPDGSVISPFAFVPLMEMHGLIDQLFITILSQTLAASKVLQQHGYLDLKLAVNLAASTLATLNLPDIIDRELQQHDVVPEQLILEITESGLMHDARIGLDVLLRLRLKGIGLSIDDFGTGYSTIDQLRRLPFTELKVDQSFVASAAKNPASKIILESSIDLARRLNLRTVAEGVESEDDLAMIRNLGCDVVQGFLVSKPMPLDAFIEWLKQQET